MLVPLAAASSHWSALINLIIHRYFADSFCTCILWHRSYELELQTPSTGNAIQFVNIWPADLQASFSQDVFDFAAMTARFDEDEIAYNALEQKLTASIAHTHCESFIAFQADIPMFCRAFRNASMWSQWRSQRNKFLFIHSQELQQEAEGNLFDDFLFIDQPNVLVIEMDSLNATTFELRTNKFVGSLHESPEELYVLDRFYAVNRTFEHNAALYFDKLKDLSGREIISGVFDYRPFTVVDFELQPQLEDLAADNLNGSVHVDGTELRVLLTFCELYNCTVQVDTSEKFEWGATFPNGTGTGILGMLLERRSQVAVGALYLWIRFYHSLDITAFLGRSGVTCLVPAPKRLTNWDLPLKPFQFTLWLAVALCLTAEIVALLFVRRVEPVPADPASRYSWAQSFEYGYVTTLKLFISQGTDYAINSYAMRLLLFSCYIIDIIVTSVYGGGLASILTLPSLEVVADSVERLNSFGLLWTATSFDWIDSIKYGDNDPIVMNLAANYRVHSFDEMRKLAKTENMGFVLERMAFGHFGNGDFLTHESLDRLKLMTDDIYFQYTVAFVPRLWPFLANFDGVVHACHAAGLDKFWEWRVTADYLNDQMQRQIMASQIVHLDDGPVELDMANFAGLIVLWLLGIGLSILVFCGELCYHSWQNKSLKALLVENSKL